MYGSGILKTLAMTFYHFLMTYVEDVRGWFRRSGGKASAGRVQSGPRDEAFRLQPIGEDCAHSTGCRSLPFFIIDAQTEQFRCTACGICAQICPVQCIWIERAKDPDTGRPRRYPLTYYLDTSLCMACGYCAEFCPFDAIKMERAFEPASSRRPGLVSIRNLTKLESQDAHIEPPVHAEEPQPKSDASDPDS